MHTTRNRLAQSSRKQPKPSAAREEHAFMLRKPPQNGAPPQNFPADLIVPPHRGAVITTAPWPTADASAPAARPAPQPAPARPGQSRKAAKKAARRAAALARAQRLASRTATDRFASAPSGELPAASISPPDSLPVVRFEPECPPALALLPEHAVPLPTARALVPRRQGIIDALAFLLRDSGRRLTRWSSARRRADELKVKLVKAEARMRAMEAQMAALQALQEHVRQS